MIKTTIKTDAFNELLLPFKYKDILIYSKSLGNVSGLFGYKDDSIFFKPLSELGDTFEIDSPESLDELHEFMSSMDYIIQRISMNKEITVSGHLNPTDMEKILKPFVSFSKTFEHNVHILEGLKYAQ